MLYEKYIKAKRYGKCNKLITPRPYFLEYQNLLLSFSFPIFIPSLSLYFHFPFFIKRTSLSSSTSIYIIYVRKILKGLNIHLLSSFWLNESMKKKKLKAFIIYSKPCLPCFSFSLNNFFRLFLPFPVIFLNIYFIFTHHQKFRNLICVTFFVYSQKI